MSTYKKLRWKWKTALFLMGISIFTGLFYPILSDGFSSIYPFIAGFCVSLIGGSILTWFELVWFRTRRNLTFLAALGTRVLFYTFMAVVIIGLVTGVIQSIRTDTPVLEYMQSQPYHDYLLKGDFRFGILIALVCAITSNFFFKMGRKFGPWYFFQFLTGKYHKPVEEERVFLFLDMNNSTPIAEKLGHMDFHHLLDDCFNDLAAPVLKNHGEVYQYIGDEAVITWPREDGFENANCLRVLFDFKERIGSKADEYQKKYGLVPRFKGAIHYGKVVTGEVGKIKSSIVFSGDVLNTTSRIEKECKTFEQELLISEDLHKRLTIPDGFQAEFVGKIHLRGKGEETALYGIQKLA